MATAKAVVAAFADGEIDPITEAEDFGDAIGELVNMIAGAAKGQIDGVSVSISCPTVVMGSGHIVTNPSDALRIRIPCQVEAGAFSVDICLKLSDEQRASKTDSNSAQAA